MEQYQTMAFFAFMGGRRGRESRGRAVSGNLDAASGTGSISDTKAGEKRMLTKFLVVGMQYYCLAKIIQAIYNPQLSKLGFSSHRIRRQSEVSLPVLLLRGES